MALSADGCRAIASADDIVTLHELVAAAGEDPEGFAYEHIVLAHDWQGAAKELP